MKHSVHDGRGVEFCRIVVKNVSSEARLPSFAIFVTLGKIILYVSPLPIKRGNITAYLKVTFLKVRIKWEGTCMYQSKCLIMLVILINNKNICAHL